MNPLQFIADYIEKARSYVYGIFAFWLGFFALPIIFTALFIDQELLYKEKHLLKGEYILNAFFTPTSRMGWIYLAVLISGPFLMTWLTIWKFPKWIVNKAYLEELKNQSSREFLRLEKENEINLKRKSIAELEEAVVKKEAATAQKQGQIENREQLEWKKDYQKFAITHYYNQFYTLLDVLYGNDGLIISDQGKRMLDSDEISFYEANGLVVYNGEKRMLTPTPKGMFFMKEYHNSR